ncbi:hypothetical protein MNBD_NITROSPIRAE01-1028 [hydrothermal vent metagenome]|uniref:Extradiol ring-cleavage dioxygenase class III enzyme subunit B domain-containing protein n=1 Tax=hydrothermal vent metagenome TaxID=652676 RepID=A0A3B1CX13_9ZZZZ
MTYSKQHRNLKSGTMMPAIFIGHGNPVLQLSLDIDQDPQFHFDLGRALSSLRKKGVLILGSGNMTHNLSQLSPGERPTKWALSFDEDLKQAIDAEEDQKLVHCKEENALYAMAHPSDEHYLPLLYLIAQRQTGDTLRYFNADFDLSTISMRSFISAPWRSAHYECTARDCGGHRYLRGEFGSR